MAASSPSGWPRVGFRPEWFARPSYEIRWIGGASYRVLKLNSEARCLDSAVWSERDFNALSSRWRSSRGGSAPLKDSEKRGVSRSERASVHASDSEGTGSSCSSSGEIEPVLSVEIMATAEQLREEEVALTAEEIALCAVIQQSPGVWKGELRAPNSIVQSVLKKHEWAILKDHQGILLATCASSEREGDEIITVQGNSDRRVCVVMKRINTLLQQTRLRRRFTHFISLPLADSQRQGRFNVYKHMVSAVGDIDQRLFVDGRKLHFTLLLLRLLSPAEVRDAAAVLRDASAEIYDAVGTQTLLVHLKGNSVFFNEDESAANVVYAPLYSSDGQEELSRQRSVLNSLVALLAKRYMKAGLLQKAELDEQRALDSMGAFDVQFHCTLLKCKQRQKLEPFDATRLVADMRGFDFGKGRVSSVQLNVIGSEDPQNGFYECLQRVNLP